MFNWLRKLFKREPKPISPDQIVDGDAFRREIAARAWNTGKCVFGKVDEEGNLHMEEIE